jgi:hypothetical protein
MRGQKAWIFVTALLVAGCATSRLSTPVTLDCQMQRMAAVSILRLRDPRTAALRHWATGIAARRGKKIAVVALARRLAGLLYAMLRDGTTYTPRAVRHTAEAAVPL